MAIALKYRVAAHRALVGSLHEDAKHKAFHIPGYLARCFLARSPDRSSLLLEFATNIYYALSIDHISKMKPTEFAYAEIRRFLASAKPEVLCISGKWGVGKTYTWKKLVIEAQAANKIYLDRYAYVSLFGQNSLDDIRTAIFEETVDRGTIGQGFNIRSLSNSIKVAKNIWRRRWRDVRELPFVKDYLGGASQAYFLAVRKQIICIDDLERAGVGLSPKDVLGLTSFLKEERECKLVLLLNDEQLEGEGKREFVDLLEKVIDVRVEFKPTSEEVAELGLDTKSPFFSMLAANVVRLDITNIRVVKKIELFPVSTYGPDLRL